MNGGIVSTDRLFQWKVLLFQRETQILTACQAICPARRVLSGTRKTAENVLFRRDTLAGVAWWRFDGDDTVQAYPRMVAYRSAVD